LEPEVVAKSSLVWMGNDHDLSGIPECCIGAVPRDHRVLEWYVAEYGAGGGFHRISEQLVTTHIMRSSNMLIFNELGVWLL